MDLPGQYGEALRHYVAGMARYLAEQDATKRLAEARQWPGFREHEGAIAQAMRADADLSLGDAYRQVVFAAYLEGDWALTPDGFVRR